VVIDGAHEDGAEEVVEWKAVEEREVTETVSA
jgi:hypothetical protein